MCICTCVSNQNNGDRGLHALITHLVSNYACSLQITEEVMTLYRCRSIPVFHCFRENDQIFLNDSETQGIRGLKSKLNISQEGMALDLFQKIALSEDCSFSAHCAHSVKLVTTCPKSVPVKPPLWDIMNACIHALHVRELWIHVHDKNMQRTNQNQGIFNCYHGQSNLLCILNFLFLYLFSDFVQPV